ncbi:MAG: hypothetical protein LBE22_06810 [Azoarcus sp.]|jgi:hypothetical protein|nr:hypothetical protein [Azoarcus sp.]
MAEIRQIVFNRWQARGLVRYQIKLTYADQSSRVLEDIDYATLTAEIGADVVSQIDARKCDKGTITLIRPDAIPQRYAQRTRKKIVEVVLRRDNSAERTILDYIGPSPEYGKRSVILRNLLVKGYALIKQETARLTEISDPARILDIVSALSTRNHRLLSIYAEAQRGKAVPSVAPSLPPVTTVVPEEKAAGQAAPREWVNPVGFQ